MMSDLETERWRAVCERDAGQAFLFGVRTTRIVCRPGCASRTPRRENVRFFDDFASARAAGFRACKRCAPDDVAADADRQRLVGRACALIERDDALSLDAVAREIGVSRFHFQRLFRDVLGLTPGDYRRSRREERFRRALAAGSNVTDAIVRAGYGSASRAYAHDPLGMSPSTYRNGAPGEPITYAFATSSLGAVLVARSAIGLCAIELASDEFSALAALRRDLPRATLTRDDTELAETVRAVVAAVDGNPGAADALDLDLRGSAFARRVWNALRAIPAGDRRSYAEVAASIGQPAAARAVASACAKNALAVVIPCHRVVGSDGALRGYRWGIERKRALLARERSPS